MKQSKLRKRRVWRYAILYFVLLIIAVALVVGPIVAGTNIASILSSVEKSDPQYLFQPTGLNNNDTRNRTETGTGAASNTAFATGSATGAARIRLF